jgi:predicted MFS family arabinose efflux permease
MHSYTLKIIAVVLAMLALSQLVPYATAAIFGFSPWLAGLAMFACGWAIGVAGSKVVIRLIEREARERDK